MKAIKRNINAVLSEIHYKTKLFHPIRVVADENTSVNIINNGLILITKRIYGDLFFESKKHFHYV